MIDLAGIDSAIKNVEIALEKATVETQQKVVLVVDSALVLGTPVDTGRARGNWLPSIGTPDDRQILDAVDKGGMNAINAATGKANELKFGDTFYISNNLPYIGKLEDGHSRQAPQGFVQKALQAARAVK